MYFYWAILGILFLFLDLQKTSTIKLTLSATCLFCAIVAYKFPNNYLGQACVFIGCSGLFYILIKNVLKKDEENILKNKKLDSFIGKKAIVTKDIGKTLSIDGIGFIKYKNELWQAKSIDDKEIKRGNKVQIISKENMVMNVKAIK